MKLTRRELGLAAGAVVVLAPRVQAQSTDTKRDWLTEARAARATAGKAIAPVGVPMATEPAFRFTA